MARSGSTRAGLRKYNQVVPTPSHPNLLSYARAQLKSSASTEPGIGSGSLQGNVVAVFGDTGYNMNVGKPVVYDCATDVATLQTTGWVHMEMTPDYNNGLSNSEGVVTRPSGMVAATISVYSTTDVVTSGSGSTVVAGGFKSYIGWTTGGQFTSYLNGTGGTDYPGKFFYVYGHDKQGAEDNYLDAMWETNGTIDIYWSGLLVSRQVCIAPTTANIRRLIAFGANTSNATTTLGTARIRNCFVAKADNAPVMDTSGAIGMIGDSQTTTGGLPTEMFDLPETAGGTTSAAGGIRCPWVPKNGLTTGSGNPTSNGFDGGGFLTVSGTPTFRGDVGYMASFFRKLGKAGWMPSNNKCYATAGAGSSAMVAQLDAMMLAYGSTIPDILLAPFGTNDYISMGGVPTTDATNFDNNAKAMLTAAYNYGIKKVIMWTVPKGGTAPDYNTVNYDNALLAINAKVNALQAWCVSQGYGSGFLSVWDAFTYYGGLNVDTSKFKTSVSAITDVHFNPQGSAEFGMAFGDIATNWYSSGGSGGSSGMIGGLISGLIS